jgi:hypothetical protein
MFENICVFDKSLFFSSGCSISRIYSKGAKSFIIHLIANRLNRHEYLFFVILVDLKEKFDDVR